MLATSEKGSRRERDERRRNESDSPSEPTGRAQAGTETLRRMLEFFHGAEVSDEIMRATTLQDLLKAVEVHGLPAAPGGMRPGPDDMLTMTELAARLKLAMRTMERWHRKGVVRGIRVDDVVLFYWPAVVARLLEKYQEKERTDGTKGSDASGKTTNGQGQKAKAMQGVKALKG